MGVSGADRVRSGSAAAVHKHCRPHAADAEARVSRAQLRRKARTAQLRSWEGSAMKEAGKAIRRVVDGVEDAVEHVLKGEEEEHEHRHRHHGGHTSTGPVTVNVNIDCCCPPKGPSGPPLPPGTRPPHVTGTSDGTLPGGVVDPGGIIGHVSRPPHGRPGPRGHLYMPLLFIPPNAAALAA